MNVEQYYRPDSVEEALRLLAETEDARLLAGGTDLINEIRGGISQPKALIDISGIEELSCIYQSEGFLHIGAMVTFSSLQTDKLIAKYCPSLAEAAGLMGAVQIRNRATLGGNVANAAPAADAIPPLLSFDAQAVIACVSSTRDLPVNEVVAGINKTSLGSGEMIVGFTLPVSKYNRTAFEKIGRRKALAISRINLAIAARMDKSRVERIAVAVGAVGITAYRVDEVENYIAGMDLSADVISSAARLMDEVVAKNLEGRATAPYKRKIASTVLKRGLERIREDIPE